MSLSNKSSKLRISKYKPTPRNIITPAEQYKEKINLTKLERQIVYERTIIRTDFSSETKNTRRKMKRYPQCIEGK